MIRIVDWEKIEILIPASVKKQHIELRSSYFSKPETKTWEAAEIYMGSRKAGNSFLLR